MELTAEYGIICMLPVVIVIVSAIMTRRTVEPLLLGALAGYVILYRASFFKEFLYGLVSIIGENSWFILVFGLFGMVVTLLEKSGGALGFSDFGKRIAKTRSSSLLITWVFGMMLFIDDYLNNLAVGTAMRSITDKHRVPREFLTYVILSTGVSICVLVPLSSWAIFMISIYENMGIHVNGSSYLAYLRTIPYIFYAWAALLVVPLFVLRVVPLFGPMKKAQARACSGHSSEKIEGAERYEAIKKTSMWNFILPMLALILMSLYSNDILIGMAFGFATCLILYIPQRIIAAHAFCDYSLEGFKSMTLVTSIVLAAFLLQRANSALGLTEYVISIVEPVMVANLLPLVSFLICASIAFFTGSFWGTMAIASPILIPLGISLHVDPFIVGGAIVSAGAFGSTTCFYGDVVTLAAAVTGITNMDYAKTAIPLIIVPTSIAILSFLLVGLL